MPLPLHTLLAPFVLAASFTSPPGTTPGYLGFGFELLRQRLAATPADNLSLSPVSAGFALSVAALGARGPTQSEMLRVLGFSGRSPAAAEQANQRGSPH